MTAALLEIVSNANMRLEYCEYCGNTPGYYETHHIKTRGSGGPDIRANKINLGVACGCHPKAQEYKIHPAELIEIVANREDVSIEEVYEAIGWPVPDNLEELLSNPQPEYLIPLEDSRMIETLEDVITIMSTAKQSLMENNFTIGAAVETVLKMHSSQSQKKVLDWLYSKTGIKQSTQRIAHKVFLAFPEEHTRVPTLDWSHHKVAAFTSDPQQWIERAAGKDENGNETGKEMTIRQLRQAIIDGDVADGKPPVEDPPDELTKKRAQKVLDGVSLILSQGGETATWLVQELQKICQEADCYSQSPKVESGG